LVSAKASARHRTNSAITKATVGSYGSRLHTNSHTKFTSPVATPDSTPAAAKPRPVGGPPAGKGGTNSVIKGSGGPKG